MAETSEAACLLQSGTAYHRRIGLRRPDGALVFAGFKPGAFSLYFDDAPYYHFDLEGRWLRGLVEGVHYLKHLDASAEAIDRHREASGLVLGRRPLPFAEARDLDDAIRAAALDLIVGLDSGRIEPVAPPEDKARPIELTDLRAMLERIAAWDAAAWFRQREVYLGTYGPLPFLPPTCHSPIVLQATLGDLGGRAFGGALPDEHYFRTPAEFEEHARVVSGLHGRRVALARGVVIGGADLLRRPAREVAPYLEIAAETFPIRAEGRRPRLRDRPAEEPMLDGLYAFLDDFAPPRPDRDGFALLRAWGLRHVDLGVESGDPVIRARFAKTWEDEDLRSTVSDLKGAGLGVGVVLPVGPGGFEWADRHVAGSVDLIGSLELGDGDLVYLIDLAEIAASPLPPASREPQRAALRGRLSEAFAGRRVKVVPYSLVKQ